MIDTTNMLTARQCADRNWSLRTMVTIVPRLAREMYLPIETITALEAVADTVAASVSHEVVFDDQQSRYAANLLHLVVIETAEAALAGMNEILEGAGYHFRRVPTFGRGRDDFEIDPHDVGIEAVED